MPKRIKIGIVCLLYFGVFFFGFAQQKLTFKNYNVEAGLSSNTIYAIEQDAQGYMWFGTNNGLSRFDGYEFKTYQFSNSLPNSLGNNFIQSILKYDDDTLWIGTTMGIYIFDLIKNEFHHFKQLGNYVVWDIKKTSEGIIWIATANGVYRYSKEGGSKENTTKISKMDKLSSIHVRKLAIDDRGQIYMATFGFGLEILNPKTGYIKKYTKQNSKLKSNSLLTVYKDKEGRMWSGTFDGGLSVWDPKTDQITSYTKENSDISSNIIRSIFQISENKLLIGSEKGLNILNISEGSFINYVHNSSDLYSLSGNAIYTIFMDANNGIWLGTYFGGLSYFNKESSAFEKFYPSHGDHTLSGGAVSSIIEDEPGKFWIGTEDAGLNYYNSETGIFKKYPFEKNQDSLSYHNIHALYKDKQENLWIGTFAGGLNVYNKKTGKVKVYKYIPGDTTSLSANNVFNIHEDSNGVIWIGTTHGLNKYDAAHDRFIRVKKKRMNQRFISDIYEDKTGTIWFGTYGNGLIGKKRKSDEWLHFVPDKNGPVKRFGRFVMMDDQEGNLWLGTEGNGLVKFNFSSKSFKRYGSKYGIKANIIYSILRDDDKTLWLSTNNGIYHFDQHKEVAIQFTQWDNLQSKQFNYNAGYRALDGKMFFGGINGFNSFYPDSIKTIPFRCNVVLNNFQLFNKDVVLGEPNGKILKKTINYAEHIELSHRESVISFEYAALNFKNPQKIHYAYKMDGFDKKWNYVGKQRKATYTNVPPGNYKFLVKASTDNKKWSKPTEALAITINPPFYQHPIAYLLYVILLTLLFLLIRKILIDKAKRKNKIKMERLSVEQEKQFYNQKIEFFTTMAHEIRTPLSLITAPLEKLVETTSLPKPVSRQLKIMDENSKRLINLVNQLLDFRRIESDVYKIKKEEIELVGLIQAIYSRFSSMKYQKKVRFIWSTKMSHVKMMGDPEALTKIINNLLINAFKFTRSEVKISIEEPFVDKSGNSYILTTIEDDGIGIPEAELNNIFKKYFKISGNSPVANIIGTGIGLSLSKSLIEKHGGYLEVASTPNVNTIFRVYLPYQKRETIIIDRLKESIDEAEETITDTILIVEDDALLLEFYDQNFMEEGYKVYKAQNGMDAFKLMEKYKIDLVLSDLMMPEMDGLELCEKIKTTPNYSHIPVILLTAKTNSEAEIAGIERGADAYIAKPFKWKHIRAVVQNLLRSRARLKEKFATHPFLSTTSLTQNVGEKKLLEKITKIIEARITDPMFSVAELSSELGMSRSNLHRKLKSISGTVPNEFIKILKLKHAAKMLSENEYTIAEISYMSGFNSPSYFSKCFSEQFKMTPSDFLENRLKINQ